MRRIASWVAAAASVLLLGVSIVVGRHEQSAWQARENRGIAGVRRAVGTELMRPAAYRASPRFACLLYKHGLDLVGLELCFAPSGAIVEAIERAPGLDPKIWTLRSSPGGATVRENPTLIARLLDRLGAQTGPAIVVGGQDLGAVVPPQSTTP
jgi:hypothetical protein